MEVEVEEVVAEEVKRLTVLQGYLWLPIITSKHQQFFFLRVLQNRDVLFWALPIYTNFKVTTVQTEQTGLLLKEDMLITFFF